MELIIDCVWYLSRKDFVKFTKNYNEYDFVIDYHAIITKLSKSDIHNAEPPATVVGLHLVKQLNDVLCNEYTGKKKLLYTLKNLNTETVENLKELIADSSDKSIKYNLYIINRVDYPKKGVLSMFDTVKFIDY